MLARGADGTPPLDSPAHAFVLQAFIVMAKNAKGGSAANIVGSALSAPGVYVFSELLEIRGIREVRCPIREVGCTADGLPGQLGASEQHAPTLELLEIFAYGTWGEFAGE
jgi:COP9 signalosome complex subunit 7